MKIERVILVHGLWMGGWAMGLLKRRLIGAGFKVSRFHYRSTRRSFDGSARDLQTLIGRNSSSPVGIVAHSLGGLLTLKALHGLPDRQGRVVLLGSPLKGSQVASRIHRWPVGEFLLGHSASALMQGSITAPPEAWKVAMIAGDRPVGAGVLAGGGRVPGDGTVALDETRAEFLADRRVMHETHTSLLMSRPVVKSAARFLKEGRLRYTSGA